MDGSNGDSAKDQPESKTTAESRELEGSGDRAQNCNSTQADTVTKEFGKEEEPSEEDERSSNGLPSENALTNSDTPDVSTTMLSASELPADVTALVSENPKDEEESTLGDQNKQTSVKDEDDEVTSKAGVVSDQEEPAAKGQGDKSKEGEGKGTGKSEWLDILGNGLLMKKVRKYFWPVSSPDPPHPPSMRAPWRKN